VMNDRADHLCILVGGWRSAVGGRLPLTHLWRGGGLRQLPTANRQLKRADARVCTPR
jgi:hypothetical protein